MFIGKGNFYKFSCFSSILAVKITSLLKNTCTNFYFGPGRFNHIVENAIDYNVFSYSKLGEKEFKMPRRGFEWGIFKIKGIRDVVIESTRS